MTTLIYQCENYLNHPLDTSLYIQKKIRSIGGEMKEIYFFPCGEKHVNGQNV